MKTKFLSLAVQPLLGLMLFSVVLIGQPWNEHKGYHLYSNSHTPTQDLAFDGGYVTAGWFHPGSINGFVNLYQRMYAMRLDPAKNKQWANVYVYNSEINSNTYDVEMRAFDMKQMASTDYIIAGQVIENNLQNGTRDAFAFLMKTDQYGNVLWFRKYFKHGLLNSVIETQNNGFLACGYSTVGGGEKARLLRVNNGGNPFWLRRLQGAAGYTGASAFREVAFHSNNVYVVTGNCNTLFVPGCGVQSSEVLYAVVDENGGLWAPVINVWHYGNAVNANGEQIAEFGNAIGVGPNGQVVIGGHIDYTDLAACTRYEESLMMEVDLAGNVVFSNEIDSDAFEMGRDIIVNQANTEIVLAGTTGPDAYILITDLGGNYIDMERFFPNGNPAEGTCLIENNANNYVITGNADVLLYGNVDVYQVEQIRVPKDICHDSTYTPAINAVNMPRVGRNLPNIPFGSVQVAVVGLDIPVQDTLLCDTVTANSSFPVVVLDGLVTSPLGLASIHLDHDGKLQVNNIGSSGEDGFSIDLGESEAASITINSGGGDDSYASIELMGVAVGNPGNAGIIETYEFINEGDATIFNYERPGNQILEIFDNGVLVQTISDFDGELVLTNWMPTEGINLGASSNTSKIDLGDIADIETSEGTFTGTVIQIITPSAPGLNFEEIKVTLAGFASFSAQNLQIGKTVYDAISGLPTGNLFFHQAQGDVLLNPMNTGLGNQIQLDNIGPDGTDGVWIDLGYPQNGFSVEISGLTAFDEGDALSFVPEIAGQPVEEYTGLELSPNSEGFFDVFVFTNGFVIDIFERIEVWDNGNYVGEFPITMTEVGTLSKLPREIGGMVSGQTSINGFFDVFTELTANDGTTLAGNEIRIILKDPNLNAYTGLEITAKDANQNGMTFNVAKEKVLQSPMAFESNNEPNIINENSIGSAHKFINTTTTIYPSLFISELNVKVETTENQMIATQIVLTDLSGKVVKSQKNDDWNAGQTIQMKNLGDLLPGMYFLQIQFGNEQETHKVVKL